MMRLMELFLDDHVGPFCIVAYVIESDGLFQFAFRFALFVVLALPMFCIVAPLWLIWQIFR